MYITIALIGMIILYILLQKTNNYHLGVINNYNFWTNRETNTPTDTNTPIVITRLNQSQADSVIMSGIVFNLNKFKTALKTFHTYVFSQFCGITVMHFHILEYGWNIHEG